MGAACSHRRRHCKGSFGRDPSSSKARREVSQRLASVGATRFAAAARRRVVHRDRLALTTQAARRERRVIAPSERTRRARRTSRHAGRVARGGGIQSRARSSSPSGSSTRNSRASTSITTMSPLPGQPGLRLVRLPADVADHEAVRRAGEASVGDECNGIAEPFADERSGDVEHLAFRGRLQAFIADNDTHRPRSRSPRPREASPRSRRRERTACRRSWPTSSRSRPRSQIAPQHGEPARSPQRPVDGTTTSCPVSPV